MPWWAHIGLAAAAFFGIRYGLIDQNTTSPLLKAIATAINPLAYLISGMFVVMAVLSAYHGWRKRELLEAQTGIETIRSLLWKEFEHLIGEAYRRQGYSVEERGGSGPDGGIDLVLTRGGLRVLVQCKHWKAWNVGVKTVRELYGVTMAEGASGGILVTTGDFSQDAVAFARGKNIDLVNGQEVVRLVRLAQGIETHPQAHTSLPARTTRRNAILSFISLAGSLLGIVIVIGMLWFVISTLGPGPQNALKPPPLATAPALSKQTPPLKQPASPDRPANPLEENMRSQRLQQELDRSFEAQYSAPAGCDRWQSQQNIVECANHRIRARQEFMSMR